MKDQELLESICRRLGVLIALQISAQSDKSTLAEGVELLTRFGMGPTEIAEILNTSANVVNVTRARLKKRSK